MLLNVLLCVCRLTRLLVHEVLELFPIVNVISSDASRQLPLMHAPALIHVCVFYRMTQFVQSTSINSVMMPAAFILKFKKPIAVSQQTIKQIERLQGMCVYM